MSAPDPGEERMLAHVRQVAEDLERAKAQPPDRGLADAAVRTETMAVLAEACKR